MQEHDVETQYESWLRGRSPAALYVRWYLRHRKPREAECLWKQIGPGVFPRVLDVGCAGGFYLLDACERGYGTSVLAGVDLSETLLAEAHSRLDAVCAQSRVVLERAPAGALPFAPASFDVVLSNGMVKYLDNVELHRFLTEAHRVLAPSGRVCIAEFAAPVGWGARVNLDRIGIPTANLRTGAEIAAALAEAGFENAHAFEVDRIRRIPLTYEGAAASWSENGESRP